MGICKYALKWSFRYIILALLFDGAQKTSLSLSLYLFVCLFECDCRVCALCCVLTHIQFALFGSLKSNNINRCGCGNGGGNTATHTTKHTAFKWFSCSFIPFHFFSFNFVFFFGIFPGYFCYHCCCCRCMHVLVLYNKCVLLCMRRAKLWWWWNR